MATLPIPPRHRPSLVELTALNPADIKGLAASFDDATPSIPSIASRLNKFMDTEDPEAGAVALIALALVIDSKIMSATELTEALATALGDDFGGSDISALIHHPRVVTLAKSVDLQSSYDRRLSKLRVVTDIRLVFPPDVSGDISEITTAVVANVLYLTFYEDGRRRDISLALAAKDIEQFRDQFDRALTKNIMVQEFLGESGVSVFDERGNE